MSNDSLPPLRYEITGRVASVARGADGYGYVVAIDPSGLGQGTVSVPFPLHGRAIGNTTGIWPGTEFAESLFVGAAVRVVLAPATEMYQEARFHFPATVPTEHKGVSLGMASAYARIGLLTCPTLGAPHSACLVKIEPDPFWTTMVKVTPIEVEPAEPFVMQSIHIEKFVPFDAERAEKALAVIEGKRAKRAERARQIEAERAESQRRRGEFVCFVTLHEPHDSNRTTGREVYSETRMTSWREYDNEVEVRFARETTGPYVGDPVLASQDPDLLAALCSVTDPDHTHDGAECPSEVWTDEREMDPAHSGWVVRFGLPASDMRYRERRDRVVRAIEAMGFKSIIPRVVHHDADGRPIHAAEARRRMGARITVEPHHAEGRDRIQVEVIAPEGDDATACELHPYGEAVLRLRRDPIVAGSLYGIVVNAIDWATGRHGIAVDTQDNRKPGAVAGVLEAVRALEFGRVEIVAQEPALPPLDALRPTETWTTAPVSR